MRSLVITAIALLTLATLGYAQEEQEAIPELNQSAIEDGETRTIDAAPGDLIKLSTFSTSTAQGRVESVKIEGTNTVVKKLGVVSLIPLTEKGPEYPAPGSPVEVGVFLLAEKAGTATVKITVVRSGGAGEPATYKFKVAAAKRAAE
jgi:hypothetical protein